METTQDTPARVGAARPRSILQAIIKGAFPLSPSVALQQPESSMAAFDRAANSSQSSQSSVLAVRSPSRSPSKARSLSDSTPKLAPSPTLKEKTQTSKDDHAIPFNPKTPRRLDFSRGLSLQLPSRDVGSQSPTVAHRSPLSPKVDTRQSYASSAKVLPRHSRGLEFSRACTSLHHSTIAEQSSPDSSPIITQRGMSIPSRRQSVNAMSIDHPVLSWAGNGPHERSAISSSVGSVNMFGSGESSSDEDDDPEPMDPEEQEDPILGTPQIGHRRTPSRNGAASAYGNGWSNLFSPSGSNFLNFRRSRLQNKRRSHKSSSSASGHSSVPSPMPTSPPAVKSSEPGYFAREAVRREAASRRHSLTMGTNELNISSGNDSGDEAGLPELSTPGVIRRPVTRRGNLLPKPRAFGRIQAELFEEATPVESEVKREAEVIRQVRESDIGDSATTTHSSPTMQPIASLEGITEDLRMSLDGNGNGSNIRGVFGSGTFPRSNGGGRDFWDNFEQRQTPPPPPFWPRQGSSTTNEDMTMDSPTVSQSTTWQTYSQQYDQALGDLGSSTTPQPQVVPPSAADGLRKANKRRRDDDLDMFSIKRRAVSPGMSVQNSPILAQSSAQRGDLWGQQPRPSREGSIIGGHAAGERSSSMSSAVTPLLGPKRIGLQGMTDVQGLAEKMTLE